MYFYVVHVWCGVLLIVRCCCFRIFLFIVAASAAAAAIIIIIIIVHVVVASPALSLHRDQACAIRALNRSLAHPPAIFSRTI